MSRRIGLYVAKRAVTVSVYGAASETVTITPSGGSAISVKTNSSGSGGTVELPFGTYTVKGSVSGYSKSVTVSKTTTRVDAWPNNATIYYWYGYSPAGSWAATAALPNTSPYTSNPVTPTLSVGTNSVYMKTSGDYARGGSIYLPKAKMSGSKLYLTCSGAYQKGGYNSYLALNVTTSMSNGYSPAATSNISEGATSSSLSISSISGSSYHIAMSANTCGYNGGSKPSYITIRALYGL